MKTLHMLIGDDSFKDKKTIENTIYNLLSNISENTKLSFEEGSFEGDFYKCEKSPLPGYSTIEIQIASSVKEMKGKVQDNKRKYDYVVSDLNYGPGYEKSGIEIIESYRGEAIKIIFTSETDEGFIEEAGRTKGLDFLVAPAVTDPSKTKIKLLADNIAKYETQKVIKYENH